jgi:ribosomal protein L11 methyltransferase
VRVSAALHLSFPSASPELIDLVTASLDDFAPAAVHETGADDAPEWRVFFGRVETRDEACASLTLAFEARGLTIAPVDVPDDDWAARSQAGLRAVRVGRIIVAPPWDVPPAPAADDHVVVIQPSMGFGTGHHETTRLCLALLQAIDCRGRRVLDVGTGSGVLALAAAALGARSVEGIDVDPDALTNAAENLALNPSLARAAAISLKLAGLRPSPAASAAPAPPGEDASRAEIVLANLTGALLIAAAPALLARTGPGSSLVLSGFHRHESAPVREAFARGADLVTDRSEGDWDAALFCRR